VPNGASLAGDARGRARQMAKLKAEGLTPSVPDLMITTPWVRDGELVVVTAVEMKRRKGGKLTKGQREWIEAHRLKRGWHVMVCHGAEDAVTFLRQAFRTQCK